MAEFDENKVNGVFGGATWGTPEGNTQGQETTTTNGTNEVGNTTNASVFTKVDAGSLPTKPSVWSKIRSFLFQEIDLTAPIKVELTPYQQKVEDEINEFLHQEISFKGFWNIVTGKK